MGEDCSIGQGGSVRVMPSLGVGVSVEVCGCGYSQPVLVPESERIRVARALRAGEGFESLDESRAAILWARPTSRAGWLSLRAATAQTHHDMQYPSVDLDPEALARLAELFDLDPLAAARKRTDDNLRGVFG